MTLFADIAIPLDIKDEAVADRGNEKSGGTTTARRDGQRQREKADNDSEKWWSLLDMPLIPLALGEADNDSEKSPRRGGTTTPEKRRSRTPSHGDGDSFSRRQGTQFPR